MARAPRSPGTRLLLSALGCLLAIALALATRQLYRPPNLGGVASRPAWLEGDFLCAVASSACALAVGVWANDRRAAARRSFSASLVRALCWFALTLLLFAVWAHAVSLFTLLIAPSHAFAGLRVATLLRAWQSERLWRKTEP